MKSPRKSQQNRTPHVRKPGAHREHGKQKMGFRSSSELLRFAFEYLLGKGQAPNTSRYFRVRSAARMPVG